MLLRPVPKKNMYNRKGLAAITEAVFTDAKAKIIDPDLTKEDLLILDSLYLDQMI